MPRTKKFGKNKQVTSELNVLLSTEMGFLNSIKSKQIKFDPKPRSKPKKSEPKKENLVDFHVEIVKKIDETIDRNELEKVKEFEEVPMEEIRASLENVVEIRDPWVKTPQFTPEVQSDLIQTQLQKEASNDDSQPTITNIKIKEKKQQTGEKIKKPEESLGKIKMRKKEEKPAKARNKKVTKNNGFTKTKKEVEKTKIELERRKKEIEEMEKIAKLKEEEFKKLKKEKEKQRKLDEKRREKEEKRREKERKIKEKQKQKELRKLEKQREIEEKKRLKEEEIKRLLAEKEAKIKEKEALKKEKKKKPEPEPIKEEINIRPTEEIGSNWDEEVSQAITIIDNLLEKLPEEAIDEFVKSDDFAVYERVVKKYKQKGK